MNNKNNYDEVKVEKIIRTDSYFDGKFIEYIAYKLLAFLISLVSLGIAKPWADKLLLEYQFNHTVYNGKRLKFEGKGTSLFVERFKWILLSIVTLGIYTLWIPLNMEKWIVSNLHFEDEELINGESYFDGKILNIIGVNIFAYFVSLLSLSLLFPFAVCYKYKWVANHTVINKKRIVFNGKSLSLIGHYLLWYLLSIITFGIYGLWLPMKVYSWKIKNIHIKIKDEVVEKESNLPYILSPILIILFVTLLIFIIPKIKIDKDKNIFENISNKINKKDNSSAKSTEKIKYDTSCINKDSLNKIKEFVDKKYDNSIIECNKEGLVLMFATNNDKIDFKESENEVITVLNYLSEKELNDNKIMISYEKHSTNSDFYLYGEKEKNNKIINWTSENAQIKSTDIRKNISNSNKNTETKKTVTTKQTETSRCPDNAVYIDGNCYDKNSYISLGTCGYLTEIDGKCYYPGCDESNYLTDESCINDYENKPNSNECPTGFKYKDGLCYGSLIN